jgi:hypothetical protein
MACRLCAFSAASRKDMSTHLFVEHSGVKAASVADFGCVECSATFTSASQSVRNSGANPTTLEQHNYNTCLNLNLT